MTRFLSSYGPTLNSTQDAGLLRRSFKRNTRLRARDNSLRRVQACLSRCCIARALGFRPGLLQKCDRLSGAPDDEKTILNLQLNVRIPDADHCVLRVAGCDMVSNSPKRLPLGCGHKCEPRFVCGHLPFHCQSAAPFRVQLKTTEFSQGLSMENLESLQRSADLQHRAIRHLHDHRVPLDLSGTNNLIGVHGLVPPVQSLPGAERVTSNNVPAYLLIFEAPI